MPKLIIHVGMPKAGSTALQSRLHSLRSDLIEQRILYPTKTLNHNFLMAGAVPLQKLPRIFRQHYNGNERALDSDFQDFWSTILAQVGKRKPEIVVMSGENLWSIPDEGVRHLRHLLETISNDIHIVCYVRKPSDFFLSRMQQQLKASHIIPALMGVKYRKNLETLAGLGTQIHVHPYDRDTFVERDVCLDFAEKHLGGRDKLRSPHVETSHNESISGEAMAILQEYRLCIHPERGSQFTKDTNRLLRELRHLSGDDRPRLHPEVKRLIDQSSTDLRWLKKTYGITFADIDYESLSMRDPTRVKSVSDICVIDESKKLMMLNTLLHRAMGEQSDEPMNFRTVYKRRQKEA